MPLILGNRATRCESLYYTVDAQAAVQTAAKAQRNRHVPVDTFTESAPEEDLLQGCSTSATRSPRTRTALVTPAAVTGPADHPQRTVSDRGTPPYRRSRAA